MMKIVKIILIISFAVLGIVSCGSQNQKNSVNALHPVASIWDQRRSRTIGKDGQPIPCCTDKSGQPVFGYINETGKLILNLQFNYAGEFNGGLAPVEVREDRISKYGYINTQGEFVIQPQFGDAQKFQDVSGKLLALVNSGGKYGFIDNSGNFAIPPQFDFASNFSPEYYFSRASNHLPKLAKVKVGDKWGFIDSSGNFVVNPQYDAAGSFSEGLALVKVGDKCGYIDISGNMVIAPQFGCTIKKPFVQYGEIVELGDFSPFPFAIFSMSLARVKKVSDITVPTENPQFNKSGSYGSFSSNGTATKSKYGYIDRTGKYVIEPQFDEAKDFSDDGLAPVGFAQDIAVLSEVPQTGLTGDEERDKAISEEEKNKPQISEGEIRVVKWGLINEIGKIVVNPIFDNIENFSEGLAVASRGIGNFSTCGYIDKTGKYVIEPKFDQCDSFRNGIAYVTPQNGDSVNVQGVPFDKKLVIDKTGKIIFTYYSPNN